MAFISPTQTTTNNTTAASSSASSSSTNTAQAQLNTNYSQFLTLLTTELKNQDPTSPLDTAQFTQQLVQYSQVEQQINTNSKLDSLIALQQSSTTLQAANYVGKTVTAQGSNVSLPASGGATLGYTLPNVASKVTITIKDSSGNTVRTISGPTAQGANTYKWDGTSTYGTTEPKGVYTVQIQATGTDGTAMTGITQQEIGKVVGVTTSSASSSSSSSSSTASSVIELQLDGGDQVPLTSVQGILA